MPQTAEKTAVQTAEKIATLAAEPAFQISRVFDAPRFLVWKAFTEPERMMHWWGPKGFNVISSSLDLRPGGIYHYCLRSPGGRDMWGKFVFREIQLLQRLFFVNSFSDRSMGLTRHPLMPNWPLELLTTLSFTEQNGRTTLTVKWVPLNPTDIELKSFEDSKDKMTQGWTGTLDQLAAYLSQASKKITGVSSAPEQEMVFVRNIQASPEAVFQAWLDPQELAQWWGPDGFTVSKCELDAQSGGAIRVDMQGPDGASYPMKGTYKQIIPSVLLSFIGAPLNDRGETLFETLNIVTLTKQDGITTLILRAQVLTAIPAAAPYLKGMQQGWSQCLERFAGYMNIKGNPDH